MITDQDLSEMRSIVESIFSSTCTVYRPQNTSDGAGGWVTGGSVVGSYSCYCRPDDSILQQDLVAKAESMIERYVLTTKWDANIVAGDSIVIDGETYQVFKIENGKTNHLSKSFMVTRV